MVRWEYLNVLASDDMVLSINGQPTQNELVRALFFVSGENLTDFLAKVGQEGWELVGFGEGPGTKWRLIFKRPVP